MTNKEWTYRYYGIYALFMGVFVTFVILTNTIGSKLFQFSSLTLPVSVFWYPVTFLLTDIVSEIYGKRMANLMVITGFVMSVQMLIFLFIGMAVPPAEGYQLNEEYIKIFSPSWRLLIGSMTAYLLAQMIDVKLYHFFKDLTQGKHLWLRNNGSTMISQLVDSLTVNFIFLYHNDTVYRGTFWDLLTLSLTLYLVKLVIALLDTPFCYLGVHLMKKSLQGKTISD